MNSNRINQLLQYGLNHHLFKPEDKAYVLSRIQAVISCDNFQFKEVKVESIHDILNDLSHGDEVIKTRLIECLLPRPSEIQRQYRFYYKKSPQQATAYYHAFCESALLIASDWKENLEVHPIITDDFQGVCLVRKHKYKPYVASIGYLSIKVSFNNEKLGWLWRYESVPWIQEQATISRINQKTIVTPYQRFNEMLDFLNKYPDYFIAPKTTCNQMMWQNGYQIGKDSLPLTSANVMVTFKYKRMTVECLEWPLAVVRVSGNNENKLIDLMIDFERQWQFKNLESKQYIYPIMMLDGSQFHVYIFFLKELFVEELDFFDCIGMARTRDLDLQYCENQWLENLKQKHSFLDNMQDFIKFIKNAI